jgi:hypothetical protein
MLTKLTIRNFKRFQHVEIELGNPVVFVGPNNSGKTTALQALAFWDLGVKRWLEKRGEREAPGKRPGVTINRRDLLALPVPDANLLWRHLHVPEVTSVGGKPQTKNIRADIIVEGVNGSKAWQCGLEFDYANSESLYCRPLRLDERKTPQRMPVPTEAGGVHIAFLQPMSGLVANEDRLDPGAINVRLGEGRTAEVFRNLCYQVTRRNSGADLWDRIVEKIRALFGVTLEAPQYIPERGEIVMTYRNPSDVAMDISSSGRGLQQTLLLLAHLTVNPGSVLLLDEPDAHLEILRQRQIYQLLTEWAGQQDSQIIAASHSEVILNEAADRDVVVAFVGLPHRIDDRGSQVLKALKEIGFDQYYQAEQTGWILYLEGSTDLAILRAFAESLRHKALEALARPFVHYVSNLPSRARDHFYGLREAKADLVGVALFDRLDQTLQTSPNLKEYAWQRREIENYLCSPETLLAWAEHSACAAVPGALFYSSETSKWRERMQECIEDVVPRVALRDPADRWWRDVKASDEFLDRLFERFFSGLGLPNLMGKTDYHVLAGHVPREQIGPEVSHVLDLIAETAAAARPVQQ